MILNASGCLDALAAPDVARSLDAFVTKTVTPLPRGGNPPVRIAETEHGMLNAIGLANPGIDAFVEQTLPRLLELDVPIWVSVGGFCADDYARSCLQLDGDEVAVIELNLSCPNVETGLLMGADPREAARAVDRVRGVTRKPLIVKLTPTATDPAAVAAAAESSGADGVSLVNTLKGMALDPRTGAAWLGGGTGGLSGPAIRAVALEQVHAVSRAVTVPVVGMGGIQTGCHAADFLRAGATAVALGTESFRDPVVGRRVRDELAELASREPAAVTL